MQHLGSVDKVEDLLDKIVKEDCLTQTEAEVPGIMHMVFDKVQRMEWSPIILLFSVELSFCERSFISFFLNSTQE